MWLIFKSIEFEKRILFSKMWVGFIQIVEGCKRKHLLGFQPAGSDDGNLNPSLNVQAALQLPNLPARNHVTRHVFMGVKTILIRFLPPSKFSLLG